MKLSVWRLYLATTILSLFLVCTGSVGWAADPIDWSKSVARSNPYVMGAGVAAAACFNPEEAVPLWQRMGEASGGQAPPEFSSTHPNPGTRIQNLSALMPKAMAYRQQFCETTR